VVPRIIAAAFIACALVGCSSSNVDATYPKSVSSSSALLTTTSTLDASASSSLDANGATAVLTLFAAQLKAADPAITQAEADCIPSAVLQRITPQELFAVVDAAQGTLTPEQASKVDDALRSCGLTDEQIAKVPL